MLKIPTWCQIVKCKETSINQEHSQLVATNHGGHALQPKSRSVWLLGAGTLSGHAFDGSCDRLVCVLYVVVSLVEPPCRLLCCAHLQITHPQHPAEMAQVAQEAPARPCRSAMSEMAVSNPSARAPASSYAGEKGTEWAYNKWTSKFLCNPYLIKNKWNPIAEQILPNCICSDSIVQSYVLWNKGAWQLLWGSESVFQFRLSLPTLASGHSGKRLKLPQQRAARSYSHEQIGKIKGRCRACATASLEHGNKTDVGRGDERGIAPWSQSAPRQDYTLSLRG
jgi:hypothetical protein